MLLEFRALGDGPVPPFAGSSIRGALGYLIRDRFCRAETPCQVECSHRDGCVFYSCFARDRAEAGAGPNIPKPLLLAHTPPPQLERILLGAPVNAPFRISERERGLPVLECPEQLWFQCGDPLSVRLVLIGPNADLTREILRALARRTVRFGGCMFRLTQALDTTAARSLLYDADIQPIVQTPALQNLGWTLESRTLTTRVRIVLPTPLTIKTAGGYARTAPEVAKHLLESCLVRAMKVHDVFCAHDGKRLPWMPLPAPIPTLAGAQLYLYRFPIRSFPKNRERDVEGLTGWLDLEGPVGAVLPLLRAAELLHAGQNPTFGMGQIRCVLL